MTITGSTSGARRWPRSGGRARSARGGGRARQPGERQRQGAGGRCARAGARQAPSGRAPSDLGGGQQRVWRPVWGGGRRVVRSREGAALAAGRRGARAALRQRAAGARAPVTKTQTRERGMVFSSFAWNPKNRIVPRICSYPVRMSCHAGLADLVRFLNRRGRGASPTTRIKCYEPIYDEPRLARSLESVWGAYARRPRDRAGALD